MKYLIDSNIIIYHLDNEPSATKFLKEHIHESCISQINYIEILSYDFSIEDRSKVEKLLELFEILDIDGKIARQCVENRKTCKIKVPDNIIAATAMVHGLILVTRNIKDFKNLDLETLDIHEAR